jgi:hypothetical protein
MAGIGGAQNATVRSTVRFKVTLRLAVYRQLVRLSVKTLDTHDQTFFFSTEPSRS